MANECLVTKLKGVVQNDNLPKLNTLELKYNFTSAPSSSSYLYITSSDNNTQFKLSNPSKSIYDMNGTPIPTGNVLVSDSFYNKLLDTGEYSLEISPKYSIIMLKLDGYMLSRPLDLANIEHVQSLTYFRSAGFANQVTGNIKAFRNKRLTSIIMQNQSGVYGEFDEILGPITTLVELNIGYTQLTGTIERFVQLQVKAGRSTYSFDSTKLKYLGGCVGITFNNQSIINRENNSLSWDTNSSDNSKIDITLNDTTVTVNKLVD